MIFEFLCLFFSQLPGIMVFDEVYYAQSAIELLTTNLPFVYPHTVVGTEFIAIGIAIFGNNPLGWRFMSMMVGTIGIITFYLLTLKIFKSNKLAIISALLLAFNSLYFSLSSVGVLDIFYFVPALISLTFLAYSKGRYSMLMLSALFMGLSVAVKINFLPLIPFLYLLYKHKFKSTGLWLATSILSFVLILTLSEFVWAKFNPANFVDPLTRLWTIISVQTSYWEPNTDYTQVLRPISPLYWFVTGQPYKYPYDTIFGGFIESAYWSSVEIPIFSLAMITIPFTIYLRQWKILIPFLINYVPWLFFDLVLSHPVYYFYSLAILPFIIIINLNVINRGPKWLPTAYVIGALIYFIVVQLPIGILF